MYKRISNKYVSRWKHFTAKLQRLISPGYGYCGNCGTPWNWTKDHCTNYGNEGMGCFPLCEECWSKLTIEERMPHYKALWVSWIADGTEREWADIEKAVMAGK